MNLWALLLSFFSSLTTPGCCATSTASEAVKAVHEPAEVVVLMATDRPDSNTSRIADNFYAAYQQEGLSTELFKVTDFGPEFFAPTAYTQKPEAFTKFNDAVLQQMWWLSLHQNIME